MNIVYYMREKIYFIIGDVKIMEIKKKISFVIPMYYEEKVVEECYKRVKNVLNDLSQYDHEIIVVNDGSTDETLPLLEKIAKNDKSLKVISFSRNFGHQVAVTAGLKYVTGDAIVIIDADLQDPPELIKDMIKMRKIKKMQAQNYEVATQMQQDLERKR